MFSPIGFIKHCLDVRCVLCVSTPLLLTQYVQLPAFWIHGRAVPISLFCGKNQMANSGQGLGSRSDMCHFQAQVIKCWQVIARSFSLLWGFEWKHLRWLLLHQRVSLCDHNKQSTIACLLWIRSVSKKYTFIVSSL